MHFLTNVLPAHILIDPACVGRSFPPSLLYHHVEYAGFAMGKGGCPCCFLPPLLCCSARRAPCLWMWGVERYNWYKNSARSMEEERAQNDVGKLCCLNYVWLSLGGLKMETPQALCQRCWHKPAPPPDVSHGDGQGFPWPKRRREDSPKRWEP